jgi:hypothetical protein
MRQSIIRTLVWMMLAWAAAGCNLSSAPPTLTIAPTEPVAFVTRTPLPTMSPIPTRTLPPPLPTVFIPTFAPPTATPVFQVNQGGAAPACSVLPSVNVANIRNGAGTNFTIVAQVRSGNWLRAVRLTESGWYQVTLPGTPAEGGWISNTVTALQQPCVCGPNTCVSVSTPPPTFTPTATNPPPPNTCVMNAVSPANPVNMYVQPALDNAIWGVLNNVSFVTVVGRTDNGWYAVDPGVAQAVNVGIYRLRWVRTDAAINLSGAPCGTLPILNIGEPLPHNDCTVAVQNVANLPVYEQHTLDSAVWAELPQNASAVILGQTAPNTGGAVNGWYAIDPGVPQAANVGLYRVRWLPIDPLTTVLSGTCDALPTVSLVVN